MAELKARQALYDLNHMAMNDALTGLPNRVQFRQQLTEASRRTDVSGEKVVGLLDLDQFNLINDTFGHAEGNLLLREVARRVMKRLEDNFAVPFPVGDREVFVHWSFGVSMYLDSQAG